MGVSKNPNINVQAKLLLPHLKKSSCDGKISILDFGCGSGTTSYGVLKRIALHCPNFSYQITGYDVSEKAIENFVLLHEKSKGFVGEVESSSFKDESFDLIFLNDVLEHVVNTDMLMREIKRILRPDGILILTTPNLSAWFNRILFLLGWQPIFTEISYEGIFGRPGAENVGHLRVFTAKALIEFLQYHEFRVLSKKASTFHALPWFLAWMDYIFSLSFSFGSCCVVILKRDIELEY